MPENRLDIVRKVRGKDWLFPLGLLLVVIVLTTAKISGSSLAVYEISAGKSAAEAELFRGQIRPVRSDEWLVRTPWLLSQVNNGLPSTTSSGVGSHDASVVGDIPVQSLDILVRPHHITSWFLGPERALAAEWWVWHLLLILGVFFFLLTVTGRSGIAACAGLLLALSPSTQWWVAPGTFTTVGYGLLASAFLLRALDARGRRRFISAGLSGWSLASFACTLYVPWMITTAIIVGIVTACVCISKIRSAEDKQSAVKSLLIVIGVAGCIAAALSASFVLRHVDGMRAVSGTVYPGQRAAEVGGTLNPASIFGAPYDYNAFSKQTVVINGTNQSENSSGIMYLIPVAVAFFGLAASGCKIRRSQSFIALGGVLVAGLILFSWAVLPLPSYVGKLFLLDRVPPARVLPALSLASVLALALIAAAVARREAEIPLRVAVVSVLTFSFVQLWAVGQYRIEQVTLNPWRPLVLTLLLAAAVGLCFRGKASLGFLGLMCFGTFQFLNINPLQVGAESILKNPVSKMVSQVENQLGQDVGWLTIGADIYVRGTIEASGAEFVSGISRYPAASAWRILDMSNKFEEAWNRYAHLAFEVGPPGSSPSMTSPQADVVYVTVDPCDQRLKQLNVDVVVTQDYELPTCGRLVAETSWGARTIRAYDMAP